MHHSKFSPHRVASCGLAPAAESFQQIPRAGKEVGSVACACYWGTGLNTSTECAVVPVSSLGAACEEEMCSEIFFTCIKIAVNC